MRLSVGGPFIGLCIGALASYVLGFILNDPLSEITTTLIVGYGSFIMAESTGFHASGVLAMVVAGLYMSFYGRCWREGGREGGREGRRRQWYIGSILSIYLTYFPFIDLFPFSNHQTGRGRVSARVRAELNSFWAIVGFISNTLIFVVAVRLFIAWEAKKKGRK